MIPEAACVTLTSSKIGTVHSVVFAKFSAQSLKDRIAHVQSALVVTGNEGLRGKNVVALVSIIDAAIADLPFVTTCWIFRHTDAKLRDVWSNEKAAQMRSCSTTLVPQGSQRHGAHHGRVSAVDVAHGEDCFRFPRWYCYPTRPQIVFELSFCFPE